MKIFAEIKLNFYMEMILPRRDVTQSFGRKDISCMIRYLFFGFVTKLGSPGYKINFEFFATLKQ